MCMRERYDVRERVEKVCKKREIAIEWESEKDNVENRDKKVKKEMRWERERGKTYLHYVENRAKLVSFKEEENICSI